MTIDDWLASACADADRRKLPDLKPLLVSLAEATAALRSAGWGHDADAGAVPGATAPAPPEGQPGTGAVR